MSRLKKRWGLGEQLRLFNASAPAASPATAMPAAAKTPANAELHHVRPANEPCGACRALMPDPDVRRKGERRVWAKGGRA